MLFQAPVIGLIASLVLGLSACKTASDSSSFVRDAHASGGTDNGLPQFQVLTAGPDSETGSFRISFRVLLPTGGSRKSLLIPELQALGRLKSSNGELMETFVPKLAGSKRKTLAENIAFIQSGANSHQIPSWTFFFDSNEDAPNITGAELSQLFASKQAGFADVQKVLNTEVFPKLYSPVFIK